MTCMRLGALVFAAVLPGALLAQGFEGRITADMGGMPGGNQEVVILTKGEKSRMDVTMQGMDMYMIMDGANGVMLSVMPSQRMYMKMNLKDAASMSGMGDQAPAAPKFTRTGKRETIAGRECEHILMTAQRGEMDMCVAKGMGFFVGPGGGPMSRGPSMPVGYEDLMREFKDGFFPLKIEMVEGAKRTQFLLVKTIEPQRLEASLFAPPAGFQEMTMPGMPGMPGRP